MARRRCRCPSQLRMRLHGCDGRQLQQQWGVKLVAEAERAERARQLPAMLVLREGPTLPLGKLRAPNFEYGAETMSGAVQHKRAHDEKRLREHEPPARGGQERCRDVIQHHVPCLRKYSGHRTGGGCDDSHVGRRRLYKPAKAPAEFQRLVFIGLSLSLSTSIPVNRSIDPSVKTGNPRKRGLRRAAIASRLCRRASDVPTQSTVPSTQET